MVGDLHCHTNFSDGSIALKDAVIYAKNKSLGYLAITDHDTMEGVAEAVEIGNQIGVTVIPGVEISCMDARIGRKVHLLCYLPIFPKRLAPLLTKISDSRRKGNIESLRLL
ncbi:MAG: PHP domain-containing protein, partial [Oscillospiraceae bacterium]